jgi:hypothetical protein
MKQTDKFLGFDISIFKGLLERLSAIFCLDNQFVPNINRLWCHQNWNSI